MASRLNPYLNFDGTARQALELAVGGTVTMPLAKQVWGDEFGMCTDQFGTDWLVNISQPPA
jgi:uncharacterized glyoxalase superfamily protein PhnB